MSESPKGALVALRDRREEVIELLCDSFSKDLLDVDAFESRIDEAHRAGSVATLESIVHDLVPAPPPSAPATPSEPKTTALTKHNVALSTREDHPKNGHLLAVLGQANRRGSWRVPRKLRGMCVLGGTNLDFREAIFSPGVTEVTLFGVLAGCNVLVPPGLAVECHGAAILGEFESLERSAPEVDPDRPLLRVRGMVVLGSVEIETRLPGESKREARRRRRRERKERKRRSKQLTA